MKRVVPALAGLLLALAGCDSAQNTWNTAKTTVTTAKSAYQAADDAGVLALPGLATACVKSLATETNGEGLKGLAARVMARESLTYECDELLAQADWARVNVGPLLEAALEAVPSEI